MHQNFLAGSPRFKFLARKIESKIPLDGLEQSVYNNELDAMEERKARLVHLRTLRKRDHHFGTVKMVSGYKMTGQPLDYGSKPANPRVGGPRVGVRPLDWAIGEPQMHRIGGNVVSFDFHLWTNFSADGPYSSRVEKNWTRNSRVRMHLFFPE